MAEATQVNDRPHTSLMSYAEKALKTNQLDGEHARDQLRFGLFGEIGGLLSLVKKEHRDLEPAEHNSITEEIGDALWYLANVAHQYGTSLQEAGTAAMHELQHILGIQREVPEEVAFEEFDALLQLSKVKLTEQNKLARMRQLAAHAGQLLSSAPSETDLLSEAPQRLLGSLLADLAMVAAHFGQQLKAIADANISKIQSRWPEEGALHLPLFDEGGMEIEQFPREFDMHYTEVVPSNGGDPYAIQRMRGINIGDRLTDNRSDPDGYRFHDVFHLAYMTHLGWSPVMRALFKVKRKSNPKTDQNEDGARAGIIEEAISTLIFNHARARRFFADKKPGRLNYDLLKEVHNMVSGYEVERCPLWQWELAILEGFAVFRELRKHGGGIVSVNLNTRQLTFTEGERIFEPPAPPAPREPFVGALPPPDL